MQNLQADQHQLDEQQIRRLLEERSQHPIAQIKRSILFELGFLLLFTIAFAVGYRWLPPEMVRLLLISLVIAWPLSIAMLIPSYLQTRNVYNADESLKENLQKLVRRLDNSTKVNRFFATIAPAIGFLGGHWLLQENWGSPTAMQWGIDVVIAIILCLIFAPLANWYLKRWYGDHIQELKDCLKEFD